MVRVAGCVVRLVAWLVAWLVAGIAGLAGGAGAWAGAVPLTAHRGALIVQVTVNDRFEGRFLLDTGASYCVVSKEVAREAKIRGRTGGDRVQLMTANGPIDANLGEAREVEVGDARARDVVVAVVDEDPAPGLDGVLGLSFLGRFRYTVDAAKGTLVLKK